MSIQDMVMDCYRSRSEQSTREWEERHKDKEPRLFASSLGACVRKGYLSAFRVANGYVETHPFDDYVTELMELGKEAEKKSKEALEETLTLRGVALGCNVELGNEIWSGRADFLIDECEQYPLGATVEHKSTSHWNFRVLKDGSCRLPYLTHCLQVLAYQRLLNTNSPAILVYRNWNLWAEFEVRVTDNYVSWEGNVSGKGAGGAAPTTLVREMAQFEQYWPFENLPPVPYSSPLEQDFGCTKKTKKGRMVACTWYGHCWPSPPEEY